jgi:hypothetical protein
MDQKEKEEEKRQEKKKRRRRRRKGDEAKRREVLSIWNGPLGSYRFNLLIHQLTAN